MNDSFEIWWRDQNTGLLRQHNAWFWDEKAARETVQSLNEMPPLKNRKYILVKCTRTEIVSDSRNETDAQPHSRACGWRGHEHGAACHSNCPTCGGKS